MEKQIKLMESNDAIEGVEPVVYTNKNVSLSAAGKIIEIIIRKTYMIPHR